MVGVYGNPITDETLEGLPEYDGKTIQAIDRARVALKWINTEAKDVKALQFLKEEWKIYQSGCVALCLVYNATGNIVNYGDRRSIWGSLGSTPYPTTIQNGQWGAFLIRADDGIKQAVVYRGPNAEWMFALKAAKSGNSVAYTEINNINYFFNNWGSTESALSNTDDHVVHQDEWNGYSSFVSIGMDAFPIFRAVLSLKDAY